MNALMARTPTHLPHFSRDFGEWPVCTRLVGRPEEIRTCRTAFLGFSSQRAQGSALFGENLPAQARIIPQNKPKEGVCIGKSAKTV